MRGIFLGFVLGGLLGLLAPVSWHAMQQAMNGYAFDGGVGTVYAMATLVTTPLGAVVGALIGWLVASL